MLVKDRQRLRLTLVLGSGLVFLFLYVSLASPAVTETLLDLRPIWKGGSPSAPHSPPSSQTTLDGSVIRPPGPGSDLIGSHGEIAGFAPPTTLRPGFVLPLHTEIFSATTADRRYFRIRLGSEQGLNPNIIPHPQLDDTWIVVAQRRIVVGDGDDDNATGGGLVQPSVELVCEAKFIDGELACTNDTTTTPAAAAEPRILPVAPTAGDPAKCTGDLQYFSLNVGPHDARVFYGPEAPYVVYGSNSYFTCFGQWIVDLRSLSGAAEVEAAAPALDWGADQHDGSPATAAPFASPGGTELQRPPPYGLVEKNWFLFWDADGARYVHFDIAPRRSFAQLHGDGSVGRDLAAVDPSSTSSPDVVSAAAASDDACLARYLPRLTHPELEGVHQATNSLSVTLCRRADPACHPGDDNTFVLVVFHHKTFFNFHATYHPYVLLFRRRAPFALWAVGARPLWISGRRTLEGGDTEMMYVTSMSWRARGQRYHGYVDDVLFLAFGIEDRMTGGIDVLAGDLLANLGLC